MGLFRRTTWRIPSGTAMTKARMVEIPTSTSVLGRRWAMTVVTSWFIL